MGPRAWGTSRIRLQRHVGLCTHSLLPPLKSLQFEKKQVAALTEANEVLKSQIEELRQGATR